MGQKDRTLDLIETYAFRKEVPYHQRRQALQLAEHIEGGRWPEDVRRRARRAVSRLARAFPLAQLKAMRREMESFEARKHALEALGVKAKACGRSSSIAGRPV